MKPQRLLIYGFFLLLANTIYIGARSDPTIFYMSNVLFHVAFGILMFAAFLIFVKSNFSILHGLLKSAAAFLIIGAVIGIVLAWTGAYRPYRYVLYSHIAIMTIGCLLLLFHFYKANARVFALIIAVIVPAVVMSYQQKKDESTDRIVNPQSPPISMYEEGDGKNGPFFPSSAQTNTGGKIPSNFFMTADMCKRCHGDIYNQWNSSAHHFSSFNNQWYRKSIEYMQDTIGTQPSKWCGGCHDHAVIFNGMMDTPIKQIVHKPEAQVGLSCTSCHSIVHVKSTMGQGDFTIEYPALHDLAASKNPMLEKLHDYLTFLDPEPHKKVFMKGFFRKDTAAFCSSCHKVHLDVPVNHYRWSRGFNDYDNWQASGISGQGARSFYYPPKPMKCADCHMPLVNANDPAAVDGKVHSHRFPGANTALPYVNEDAVQLKTVEDFLKANAATVDIFGITRTVAQPPKPTKTVMENPELSSTYAVGEESLSFGAKQTTIAAPTEVIAPLNHVDATVNAGESVRVEVVVRTRKVGHFFPGGTVDAFDVWLELQAKDDEGKVLFWSGKVEQDGKGPVETGAHFYRSLLLDEHGNPINKRNAWAARSVAYVHLIPPGAADTAHFRLRIPGDAKGKIHLLAKLNYRKFSWWNTHFAFAGVRDQQKQSDVATPNYDDGRWVFTGDTSDVSGKMKKIPDLPIVVVAQDEATLTVGTSQNSPSKLDPKDRERWNDYGIGLLLQGDLKGAEQAFIRVTQLEPKYADGFVNIGRARIQEGDMRGAQEVLQKALSIQPDLAKTHFFLAMTLKAQGKYDEALAHLNTAAAQYPLDRVVRNQIGRILFLQRKYQDAIDQFQKTLLIDPEDLAAHYNLMLCYQGLQNKELAHREEILYARFKADEASQTITGPYRQLHPDDNNERQPIHEHVSAKNQ